MIFTFFRPRDHTCDIEIGSVRRMFLDEWILLMNGTFQTKWDDAFQEGSLKISNATVKYFTPLNAILFVV